MFGPLKIKKYFIISLHVISVLLKTILANYGVEPVTFL